MKHDELLETPLRLAIFTESISHFEVPLFRLCTKAAGLQLKVFYLHPVQSVKPFDSEYGQKIEWGVDLLAGYDSTQVANAQGLAGAAREWQADVVLLYGYGWPGAAQIILRNWWHGQAQIHRGTLNYHLDPRRPIKGRFMRPLRYLLLRMFHAHHYGGDYSRKVLLDAGISKSALFFVPYSVDTPHFLAASDNPVQLKAALGLREDLGWKEDDQVILFIAQHNWFKGPDIAMEVFVRLARTNPKARFLVVGSGRMTEDMKAVARQDLDTSIIHFAGFVPSSQTVPYYLASDLVICSSRYETWARMVNEAMLCRRPCLASRIVPAVGGLIEDGENGYVVEAPEVNQFVSAIQKHFTLTLHDRKRMGGAARLKAQIFAFEPCIGNVVAAARYAFAQTLRARTGRGAA
jgi:glycosyltransferase involved in cell wall biosynthesis